MKARPITRSRFGRRRFCKPSLFGEPTQPIIEALEDRTLLASSLVYRAVDDTPLTLLLARGKLEVVQTANPKAVLASNQQRDITAGVQIYGNGHNVPLTIDASLPSGIAGGVLFDGGSGTSTLLGPDANETWDITGAGTGDLGGTSYVQFQNVDNLTGNAGADAFVFANGATVAGGISGGGGTNTLDYSAYASTAPVTVNLEAGTATGTGGFGGIQNLIGSQAADTLIGPAAGGTWNLAGADGGTLAGVSFTGFENLAGGAAADTFVFADGATVGGTITGGGGTDTLDYSAYTTPVSVNLAAGTATGTGGFGGIQNLIGSQAADTLIGPAAGGTWNLAGANTGTVAGVTFTGFENLTGGAGDDAFVFADGATVAGTIAGGDGTNTLDYSAYATPVSVNLAAGTATGMGGFGGIQNLIGSQAADTLIGPAAGGTWNLAGSSAGTVAGVSFTGFGNLAGGAGDDAFVFADGATVGGTITGGGGTNTLDYSAYTTPVSVNLGAGTATGTTGGIVTSTIQAVKAGQATRNTFVGPNSDSTWNITALDAGNVGGVTFTGFQELAGGSGANTFLLDPSGEISGSIDGGSGGYDKLVFVDASGNQVTYAPTGSHGGSIVTPDGRTLTYADMSFVHFNNSDFSDANNVKITGSLVGDNTLSLTPYTDALVEVSPGGGGTNIAFKVPSQSLSIIMGYVGKSTLNIGSTDPLVLPGALSITGGFPDNQVILAGALTLGGGLGINAATGQLGLTVDAPLAVNAGGLSIDSSHGLAQTIQLNAPASIQGNVNIQGSVLADSVTLDAPLDVVGGNLNIECTVTAVDKQLGLDAVTLNSNVNTHGGNIKIDAAKISVGTSVPLTISTRWVSPDNPAIYVGNSGDISFDSRVIAIGAGSQLLADSDPSSTYSPGNVTLSVFVFDPSGALPVDVLPSPDPSITVQNGAVIRGGQVTLTAHKASEAQILQQALLSLQSKTATIAILGATIDGSAGVAVQANAEDLTSFYAGTYNLVNNLALSSVTNLGPAQILPPILGAVSVQERSAAASVTVTGSTIHSADGSITIDSTVNVNSNAPAGGGYNATVKRPNPLNPLAVIPYSAGYAQAVGSSETLIDGTTTISSDAGSVSLTSEATTSAVVQALTASNASFGTGPRKTISGRTTYFPSVAIGVTDTDTTSQALVGQGVQVNAPQGDVTVNANGNVTNNAWAGTATFGDGTGSFGFTMGTDRTNVLSRVDGQITAGGAVNDVPVDLSSVNQTNDTITIPNHGLTTGQAIVYHASTPPDLLGNTTASDPIGGLTDGQTYYVIVKDPNTIQLAAAPSIPLDASGIDPSVTNTLSKRSVQSVDASAVSLSTNIISLPGHKFTELQPVTTVTSPDWNLTGLNPQGTYYVHVVDADHIQLLTQIEANAGTSPRLLPGTNDYIVQFSFAPSPGTTPGGTLYLGYNEQSPVTFNPATAVQPDSSLYLPGNSFKTGDLVTYNVVQGTPTPVNISRSSLFSPGDFNVTFNPNATPTTIANDTIYMPNGTDLVTGQRVTYSAGGGTPIGGLVEGGIYYVVVTANGDIQLAQDQVDALNGTNLIHFTSSGTGTAHVFTSNAVDSQDSELVIKDHQLQTGQQVVYQTDGGTPVDNLTPGKAYYAIRISDDLLRLASTEQGASAGTFISLSGGEPGSHQSLETSTFVQTIDVSQTTPVVDYTANTIELDNHGLTTGQVIQYDPGNGDPIGGLTRGPYAVIVTDPNHIQLALTSSPNTPITLGPPPQQTDYQQFTLGDESFPFDPLLQPTVNLHNSSIWLENNGFHNGDCVTYLTGGGTPIGGLVDGNHYLVIEGADGNSFQLADPSTPGTPVTLTSLGTGSSQGFERASTGELNTPPIGGLQDGSSYFVTKVDADHILLSPTLQGAQMAAPIALTLTPAQMTSSPVQYITTTSDTSPGINVLSSLSAQNLQKTESQVGGSPTLSQILLTYVPPTPLFVTKSLMGAQTNLANSMPVSGAGAVALNFYRHDVQAIVGSTAALQSTSDVTVDAASQNYSGVVADGQVIMLPTKNGPNQKLIALAVSVAYGSYDNTALATVDPGARIDASAALTVTSELTYPDLSMFLPFNPANFDITSPTNGNWMQNLSVALNGRGGLDQLMNLWANTTSTTDVMPAKVSVTASVGIASYTNDSEAVISSGARINQNPTYASPSQYVGVFADTTMSLLNLAGLIKLQLDSTGAMEAARSRSFPISLFGNQAGLVGAGGSILLQAVNNTTVARIEDGALVNTGNGPGGGLGVSATENLVSVNLALAGGAAGEFGLSGAFSMVTHSSSTIAELESGVMVYGGPVDVKSKSDLNYDNIVGAAQVAGAVGVGASAAVNRVTRDTEAFIGASAAQSSAGNAGTVVDATGLSLDAENTGNLLGVVVAGADVDPNLAAKASSGSVAKSAYPAGKPLPLSVGVAGAVGINEVSDTAEAYIYDLGAIDLAQGDLCLTSRNDTRILAVTGSVSLAALNLLTAALAGSVSLNTLDATTESFVIGAQVTNAGTVKLDAEREGTVMAVAIAASGSTPSPLTSLTLSASITVDVAASVSLNTIGGTTEAFVSHGTVAATKALKLTATDSSTIDADGGGAAIALALGGPQADGLAIALGASVAVNQVSSTVAAYLDQAQVNEPDLLPIEIMATNASTIDAVTVAGAAVFSNTTEASLAFSGAGAGSGNDIHNTIQAYVQDCGVLQASSLSLLATDHSQISSMAIAVALSVALADVLGFTTAISMGGSATVNQIGNDVEAFIDHSTMEVGGIDVESVESSSISALSVGAAFAVSTASGGISAAGAGAGAVSANTVSNVVSAAIRDQSDIAESPTGGVVLMAHDSAEIHASADGGAISVGSAGLGVGVGLALGASVASNTISDQVSAEIDGSSVTTGSQGLDLSATAQNGIDALVIAASISFGAAGGGAAPIPIGVAASGAGAGAANTVSTTVQAAVKNGATVQAMGDAVISSMDTSLENASVSAGALAVGTFAVVAGLSVTTNTIDNQVSAYVDGSSVQSTGTLAVTAATTGNVTAAATGIATAIGIGGAAAGATALSTILTTVQADANDAMLNSSGTTQITANSSLTADASTTAASVGPEGFGIAVSVPRVSIGGSTLAFVEGTSTVTAAALDVRATSDNQANLPLGLDLAIGLVGGAGAGASATVNRVTEAFVGAETGGATTEIAVPGGNVSIVATSTSSATSNVAGGAFGGIDIAAFVDNAAIGGRTRAYVGPAATVHAASLEIHANSTENAAADLTAVGAGLISGTGANAMAGITSVTEAFAGTNTTPVSGTPGVNLAITGAIDLVASSTGNAHAQAQGGAGGLIQVTALPAVASDDGQTHAYVGLGPNSGVTAGSLNIEADGASSSDAQSFAIGIGGITVSNVSAQSTVGSSDPGQQTVAAFLDLTPGTVPASGTFAVKTPGAVTVTADMTPQATATATGVEAGIVSVDAVESNAEAQGTTSSYLGDGVTLAAGSLTLDARRQAANGPTAQASVTAGSGGVLSDVNAAVSGASSSGAVQASVGNVKLIAGNVTIQATNTSDQMASASGVAAGGLLAVGVDVATAGSDVSTLAQLGPETAADIGGTLNVLADGTDQNSASSTSGSGALFAGDAAIGNTNDTSTTSAVIGGGTIVANTVNVLSDNKSVFTSDVSSVNAAVLGAGGAVANNIDTTAANATVLPNTIIFASFAVDINAHNTFTETVPQSGSSVSAGAGGVYNGTGATSTSNLTGNSDVTIGSGVAIDVETPAAASAGGPGIFLIASSALDTADKVTLSTGGAIAGAGTNSSLAATLNNNVVTNSSAAAPDSFTTNQNIGIGTYTNVNAENSSEAHTWGVVGTLASASATTDVTSNQTVTLGPSTNLTAAKNIDLTAGDDPTTLPVTPTSMSSFTDAQSYARGFVGIPIANATTNLASNAALTVGQNDQIGSGENTTLAADNGKPVATAQGIGHGYELYFIPATNGSSSQTTPASSKVTMNGTVTAGVFHQLDITIPDDRTAEDGSGNPFYSRTAIVNGTPYGVGASPQVSLLSTPTSTAFTASFDPSFNPYASIQAAAAQGAFSSPGEAQPLEDAVSNGPVGAMVLGPLFAAGGDVTVNAGNLTGNGSITAYGGPTISVTNNSPDYLVLSSIQIPDEPGGHVLYTGAAIAPPSTLSVTQSGAGARPVVDIRELYDNPVPSSGSNGPSVFVTATMDGQGNVQLDPSGSIDNQAGQVAITVADGSLIQVGAINANQVNLSTKKGITALTNPSGLAANAGTPARDWAPVAFWPGGYDPSTNLVEPSNLASIYVAFVVNAIFNANGQYGTDPSNLGTVPSLSNRGQGTGGLGLTEDLIGQVGQTPPLSFLTAGEPGTPQITNGVPQAGTSLEFLGANTGDDGTDSTPYWFTTAQAQADSPVNGAFQFGDVSGRGEMPVVPVEPVSPVTAAAYPSITAGLTSGSNSIQTSSSLAGLTTGEFVMGTGITPGTTVASIDASTDTITLSSPATVTGIESLTITTARSINAEGVFITAKYVDVNEPINVGQPSNWSVSLSASLDSIIAQDQTNYSNGIYSTTSGDAPGYYTLPASIVAPGDAQIAAQYDAITGQIIVNSVSAASGGFVSLDGAIMSTNTLGEINIHSDLGRVTIDNQTSYPIVVNNISASKSAASTTVSGADIIDTNQPAATQQTLYLYQPGNVINEYQGTAGQTRQQLEQGLPVAVIPANTTSYSPEAGLRWAWQMQTDLTRTVSQATTGSNVPPFSDTPWVFTPVSGLPQSDPWYYVTTPNGTIANATSQPTGWTVIEPGLPAFQETIGGNYLNWLTGYYVYHNGNYGFQPTNPVEYAPAGDPKAGQQEDPWVYYFMTQVELTLTESVKADDPIGIDFSGPSQAAVTITSDTPVILGGNIANPLGDTTITAPSITQSSSAATTSNNLTLDATAGGVGTSTQPISASLTANGVLNVSAASQGVYLNLDSGAILGVVNSGDAGGHGDVVLSAAGSLNVAPGLPSGTVNVTGNNLTLNSAEGEIGSAAAPLQVQAYGVVNVSALLDIGLDQQSGPLEVGQIVSAHGNVTIDPADSPILNATGITWANEVGNARSQQVWQDLSLTNPSAVTQQTVTAFEDEIDVDYAAYWQLLENGSVQNGVLTLNAQGVRLYAGRAGLSLSPPVANPTDAQVQAYANMQYQMDVIFFNQNLDPAWSSSPDFQAYNPSFHDVATPQQVSDLTSNAAWTTPELMNPVAQVAVNPAVGSPVGIWTPNVAGVNVTLVAAGSGGSIGQTGAPTFVSLADLQSGNLTAAQRAALANATAPGDVVEQVVNGQGQTLIVPLGQEPTGFTPTGLLVSPAEQLFVSATGILNMTAGSSITVQGTSQDLTLGQVTAGGAVNIAAQGSILSGGTGIQITTPGDLVLKAGAGSVGSPSMPLNVDVGGRVGVYTPPGQAFLNGGKPTSLVLSANNPSVYGQSVTFTATVTDTGSLAAVPTGNVEFYDGTTYLGQGSPLGGSGNIATWSFTTSTLAAGVHPSIVAVFSPSGSFTGSSGRFSQTVNPAPLTVTADSASKIYGQTATFGGTAFTVAGLVNHDSITGVAESSLGAPMSATVGTYSIVPFAAAGSDLSNYTITYVNGTLTVNPAPLIITANDAAKTYGQAAAFAVTAFTESGLVTANGDTVTGVTETSAGATMSAPVGSYDIVPIAATGNRLGNYTITYVNGTLIVNPAPLTITANNATKTYGHTAAFAANAFTESGLVTANGDTVTGVTETSAGAPMSATVGLYPIVPSAATGTGLGNYTITYVNGSLTVNPAPLIITANDDSKPFGTVKTFSSTAFTATGLVTANGDTISGVTETSAGAPASAAVGTYPIVTSAATGTGLSNYTITYVNGTLTVNQSIIVLNPTADRALSLSGNASIALAGGVFVDSSSSSAISATGHAQVQASVIDVHGGVQASGRASFSPPPIPGAAILPDPLASLADPSTSGLADYGDESLSGISTATINPGIYSKIALSGLARLTMNPGVYIIEGGGFDVSGQATVSGSGVTIFNAGSTDPRSCGSYGGITLSGNGSWSLSPPTSGPYSGVVIFQPADNTKSLLVSGNASSITGEIYAPAAHLAESGNAKLNATIVVDTMTVSGQAVANAVALNASAGAVAYTPAQVRDAYGVNALALDGTGQTIAIVAAYDNPSIFQSLDAFDARFGLTGSGRMLDDQYGPASSFLTVLNQNGQATPLPSSDPNGPGTDNWEGEESLDVEWAHAIAPGARIILVEATGAGQSDLMAGVATASRLPGVSVVSMSWGLAEGQVISAADEANADGVFDVPGVTFLASTGDNGAADPEYPASSPNVVAVGGTSLNLSANQSYHRETAWGYHADPPGISIGSGGGTSMYEAEPAYQQGVQSTGSRTTPDVSLVADPATGVWVADMYNRSADNPFEGMGGTSLSAPAWAALIALVNEGRVASGETTLNRVTPTDTEQALYSLPRGAYNTIAGGGDGSNFNAGYNLVTGLGTPVANLLVPGLIAYQASATTHAGPSASPLKGGRLVSGAWSHGASTTDGFNVFSALTATGSSDSGVLSHDASLATSRAASRVNLAPTVATTMTSVAALGSPFALSISSRSTHGPDPSPGSIPDTTRADATTSPLVGVKGSSLSTGIGPQWPVWSPPRLAVISPSAQEHQDLGPGGHRWNLDTDTFLSGTPRRGLVAQSVLDDVAASLVLSRGRDGAALAGAPALPATGFAGTLEATGPGLQPDQDSRPAMSAVALMAFRLATGTWARRSGILNARKRQLGSRPSASSSASQRGTSPDRDQVV